MNALKRIMAEAVLVYLFTVVGRVVAMAVPRVIRAIRN